VLSDRLVDRIRRGGGDALAGQTAVEILLGDQGEASGVRYRPRAGGAEKIALAPLVFANASPHAVEHMLPEAVGNAFMTPHRSKPLSISLFSISLGLRQRPSELGVSAYSTMIIPEWMLRLSDFNHCAELLAAMPGGRLPALGIVDYSHIDSGLLDGELFPVSIVGFDRLTNWEGLGDEEYQARKNAWLDAVIRRLDEEWPGVSGAVAQKDIATARTMHDYLNTPGGALYGFAPNVPDKMPWSGPPRTPRTSIQGLWLASSYAGAGGFTGAISAGGAAAKAALHELM
jgi:phytoene dehydrogenase-like protein